MFPDHPPPALRIIVLLARTWYDITIRKEGSREFCANFSPPVIASGLVYAPCIVWYPLRGMRLGDSSSEVRAGRLTTLIYW